MNIPGDEGAFSQYRAGGLDERTNLIELPRGERAADRKPKSCLSRGSKGEMEWENLRKSC